MPGLRENTAGLPVQNLEMAAMFGVFLASPVPLPTFRTNEYTDLLLCLGERRGMFIDQ